MYRIGEFSYLFQVTIKTLRYYDQIDLFKPSFVDPFTGYRYYSKEQVEEFKNILKLKNLNFSLDEIKKLKEELSDDLIKQKIKELEQEQKNLKTKITQLENLKIKGESKMNYTIGYAFDKKILVIGKRIVVERKTDEILEPYFKEVEKALDKLKITYHSRVVITEEVGYKEDDVELFIGYVKTGITDKQFNKFMKKKNKLDLDWFSYPTGDYLVAIDVSKNEVANACKDLIKYASENETQIIGPFMELSNWHSDDKLDIYTWAHDLKRNEIDEILAKRRAMFLFEKNFILDEKVVGSWRVKEILPNITFNPNRQKSNPDTKFSEITFLEDGTTNFPNVTWTKSYMFIQNNDVVGSNSMNLINIGGKEYLEIRMSDMSTVYPNARPISYIYERVDKKEKM